MFDDINGRTRVRPERGDPNPVVPNFSRNNSHHKHYDSIISSSYEKSNQNEIFPNTIYSLAITT